MTYTFRKDIEKKKLFDGAEDVLVDKTFVIKYDKREYSFKVIDFDNNTLEKLFKTINQGAIDTITNEGSFTKKDGVIEIYKGTEDLRLHYVIKDNLIFILAFGEFQPTRFKVYLEGIWNMEP